MAKRAVIGGIPWHPLPNVPGCRFPPSISGRAQDERARPTGLDERARPGDHEGRYLLRIRNGQMTVGFDGGF